MRPLVLALMFVAVSAAGQDKPPVTTLPPSPGSSAQAPAYAYNPEGRRDPFVSLLRRASDPRRQGGKATEGVGGFLVSEIELKGVMQSRGTNIALVLGPDGKTFLVRVNDHLLDGTVRAITSDTLIIMQDVNDPLSLTKQREVRKTLRAAVEVK